jgi:uroporphyrinogen-III decarboxylase
MPLSSRERLLRCMRGQDTDRVPIHLWYINRFHAVPRPAWQPLYDLVEEMALDCIVPWWGASPATHSRETRETDDPDRYEVINTLATPRGLLTQRYIVHRSGKPGYMSKYLIESVEDARCWLSLPDPVLPITDSYHPFVAQVGERGLVHAYLTEPMYAVNSLLGSERWALWLYDARELLREMVAKAARATTAMTRHYLDAGIGPLFGWYGPEVCIPPLASPRDFDEFVTPFDKPIIDLVHERGGVFQVHCHGDMHPVLERFVELGVDCLNPIEPPPIGHLTLAQAKQRAAGRMTLEGGVQSGDFQLCTPDEVAATTEAVMTAGKPGGRFILSPCATHEHWPDLSPAIAANYRVFVETGLRLARYV